MQPASLGNVLTFTPKQITEYEPILKPGGLSGVGFIGKSENLKAIVQKDDAVLQAAGITYKQIADRLLTILYKCLQLNKRLKEKHFRPDDKKPVAYIEDRFKVTGFEFSRSGLRCPFSTDIKQICGKESVEFTVQNIRTQKSLKVSDLVIHLIGEHNFCEGETPYRLDPALAIEVLELVPGVDYSSAVKVKQVWSFCGTHYECPSHILDRIRTVASETITIEGKITAYVMNTKIEVQTDSPAIVLNSTADHEEAALFDPQEKRYLYVTGDASHIEKRKQQVDFALLNLDQVYADQGLTIFEINHEIVVDLELRDKIAME